jgi:hypothetical protein
MYHLTAKTSKQVFKTALSTVGRRQTIAAAQRIALIPSNTQAMTFFVVNKSSQEARTLSEYGRRGFSSLPSHTKLEMPNLSPTMEKVSISFI